MLDDSDATGQSGFDKTKQFIVMLLKSYTLGEASLRIKVVYYSQTKVQIFTFDADTKSTEYISQIQALTFTGGQQNVISILQSIQSFYMTFQRSGAGK